MGKKYTEEEIMADLENFILNKDKEIQILYKEKIINRKGKTKKPEQFYTELISKVLIDEGWADKLLKIEPISRINSYFPGHNDSKKTLRSDKTAIAEKGLAKQLTENMLELGKLGKAIYYESPLKNIIKDQAGKIDLVTYNELDKTIYIIELKGPESKETALRAVLEIATYYQLLVKEKFLSEFKEEFLSGSDIKIPVKNIKKAVLFSVGTNPANEVRYITNRKKLQDLMNKLEVEAYILKSTNFETEQIL